MKKILSIVVLAVLSATAFAQDKHAEGGINWVTVDQLAELQKKEPRKVFVDVYTKWCGPCKMMMANTFTSPDVVAKVNKEFYAVKFNAEGPETVQFKGYEFKNEDYDPNKRGRNGTHDLALAMATVQGRLAYPTMVYMDEKLDIISPVQGYHKPEQLLPLLNYISSNKYKEMSYADYSNGGN